MAAADVRAAIIAAHDDHVRGHASLTDIGEAVGVTRERVRQVYVEEGLVHGRELQRWRNGWRRLAWAVSVAAQLAVADAVPHGTVARYRKGCSCDECCAAHTADRTARRAAVAEAENFVCGDCGAAVWRYGRRYRHRVRGQNHPARPITQREFSVNRALNGGGGS